MKAAFADYSFYVALLIARDVNHYRARTVAQSWTGAVITTEYVLIEVANHLRGTPAQRARFGQFLASLEADPNTFVLESTHELWKRGVELYLSRSDKEWSLTDCISFFIMHERGLTEALTADHHFMQAGFTALLVP
jgi:predicted nucleic acid-binding protein